MTDIFDKLEAMGYTFKLAIDVNLPDSLPPEAEHLLRKLTAERDAALWVLIARTYFDEGPKELPNSISAPVQFEVAGLAMAIMGGIADTLTGKVELTEERLRHWRNTAAMIHQWVSNPEQAKRCAEVYEQTALDMGRC